MVSILTGREEGKLEVTGLQGRGRRLEEHTGGAPKEAGRKVSGDLQSSPAVRDEYYGRSFHPNY